MRHPDLHSPRSFYRTVYSKFGILCHPLILYCLLPLAALAQEDSVEPELQTFTQFPPGVFLQNLQLRRPEPVSAKIRDEIMRSLPPTGEIKKLSESQRAKIASLSRILEFHARASAYVVKIIDLPQAVFALHARCVLLISEPGLAIWSADELSALAAHEIGHEYIWSQYYEARASNRLRQLQQFELYCDGVAILTLDAAGVNPSNLTSAVKKSICYNRARLGVATNESSYPSFDRRSKFHQSLIHWIERSRAQAVPASSRAAYLAESSPVDGRPR